MSFASSIQMIFFFSMLTCTEVSQGGPSKKASSNFVWLHFLNNRSSIQPFFLFLRSLIDPDKPRLEALPAGATVITAIAIKRQTSSRFLFAFNIYSIILGKKLTSARHDLLVIISHCM